MSLEHIFALVIFLFPLSYSPGPGNMFFAANGARFGIEATVPSNIGYHFATLIAAILIGLGFATTLEYFPQTFTVIKIAGALYVFWLAWKLLKAGVLDSDEDARPASFRDGALLLVLNPKAYVIMAVMFSQFLNTPEGSHTIAILWISIIFTLNNFAAFTLWATIGDKIASKFRNEQNAKWFNTFFGVTLALVAIWMLIM
jgi:threonine/homoserine/homoserine lactone efflux protein